jgi:hypothetical protein
MGQKPIVGSNPTLSASFLNEEEIDMNLDVAKKKKRPIGVWIIFLFFLFSVGSTVFGYYLIYSGKTTLLPSEKAFFDGLTHIDVVLSLFIGLGNLIGATLLFFLRKRAFYFFATSLFVNLLVFLWYCFSDKGKVFFAAVSSGGLIGMVIALAILIAICLYAKGLEKKDILT